MIEGRYLTGNVSNQDTFTEIKVQQCNLRSEESMKSS